jgi:hypothetical protein
LLETMSKKKKKKRTINPIFNMTKIDNYSLGSILDILFRKWFPLFEVPSPRITTLEKPMSLASQEWQVAQEQ